ncbi:hypothetical protein E1200_22695 [Actinomadura sp. GC306]|nr:hypothetical protein E1200_22695 [Actinomadura sp. GC306]
MFSAKLRPRKAVTIPMTFSQRSFVVAEIIWEYSASGNPIRPAMAPGRWVASIQPKMSAAMPIVMDATASQPWSRWSSGLPSRSMACRAVPAACSGIRTLLHLPSRATGTRCARDRTDHAHGEMPRPGGINPVRVAG